jgi:predicted CoA-binding protein
MQKQIEQFLAAPSFAVVGASTDPAKFGHRCLACYLRHGRKAYPINPREQSILGQTAYPSLMALPERVESVTVVTPPAVTERVVEDAIAAGVRHLWMQPGAESPTAIARAQEAGLNVIAGGPCLLVELG